MFLVLNIIVFQRLKFILLILIIYEKNQNNRLITSLYLDFDSIYYLRYYLLNL